LKSILLLLKTSLDARQATADLLCDLPEGNALRSQHLNLGPVGGLLPATLTVLVFPGLLGSLDPFPLSFTDDVSFKLGKRSQHLKEELGERILCAVVLEGHSLLLEPHGHALDQQGVDQILEILKATDKSVDGVYPERVTFPQVLQAFLEGGTIGVLAAGLILENLGELLAALRTKLSACVLVCAADSDVNDVSVGHGTVLLACGGRGRVNTRHAPATSLAV